MYAGRFSAGRLADLGVHEHTGSLIELQSKLNKVVTEQSRSGKPLVIVIDEAQNLDDSVLELVRMLSNFETSQEKLIQIVLSRTTAARRQTRIARACPATTAESQSSAV